MTAVVTSVMLVGLLEVKADGGQRKVFYGVCGKRTNVCNGYILNIQQSFVNVVISWILYKE